MSTETIERKEAGPQAVELILARDKDGIFHTVRDKKKGLTFCPEIIDADNIVEDLKGIKVRDWCPFCRERWLVRELEKAEAGQ